ncbi:MAG: hypothetical protein H0V12_11270, partial [Chloroflexi bacterium]|nr:hypothetical protein [Chloroflexota bacterium]
MSPAGRRPAGAGRSTTPGHSALPRRSAPPRRDAEEVGLDLVTAEVAAQREDLADPDDPPYEVRPRASRGEGVPLLGNDQLARIFFEIGDMMELKGELPFKAGAYRKAADSIAHSPVDVAAGYRAGRPPSLSGVGKAINEKLDELADTGRLRFYERLRREVPPTLVALLTVPGIGPRTVKDLHDRLGILTLEDLEQAAVAGRLRGIRGMGERTEERVLAGIRQMDRRSTRLRLGAATELMERLMVALGSTPGVRALVPAGSLRRGRESIGDLDVLAETDLPDPLLERVTGLAAVERVVARGGHRASVQLLRGPQLDLMIMPPGRTGTYVVHFTGSAAHNVRLRERARDLGWSLSEHGFLRLGDDGEPLSGASAELRTFATEAEVYG